MTDERRSRLLLRHPCFQLVQSACRGKWVPLVAGAAVGVNLIGPALGATPPFAHVFRLDAVEPGLVSGVMVPGVDGAYLKYEALQQSIGSEDGGESRIMGARFDALGNLVWSLRPESLPEVFGGAALAPSAEQPPPEDPGADSAWETGSHAAIWPVLSEPTKARVRYVRGTGRYRFGIVDTITEAPVFAYELAFTPPVEALHTIVGANEVEAAIKHGADFVDVLAVDPTGALLFDTRFTGTAFLDVAGAQGRIEAATATHHSDGYYVIAHVVETSPSQDPESAEAYHCAVLSLDLAGNLLWSRTLARGEPSPIDDLGGDFCLSYAVGPDGSLVFVMYDSTVESLTEMHARTVVSMVRPDGSLSWAQSYENALLTVSGFAPDGSYLLLAGQAHPPEATPLSAAGVIARADALTGRLTHEFRLPTEETISAALTVAAMSDRHVYVGRWFSEAGAALGDLTLEIIRVDYTLADPIGFVRRPGRNWHLGSGRFDETGLLVSEFDEITGEVRVFNVDENLAPFDPTCPRIPFELAAVETGTPGLTARPASVALEPTAITATPAATAITPAALPVRPLVVTATPCEAVP